MMRDLRMITATRCFVTALCSAALMAQAQKPADDEFEQLLDAALTPPNSTFQWGLALSGSRAGLQGRFWPIQFFLPPPRVATAAEVQDLQRELRTRPESPELLLELAVALNSRTPVNDGSPEALRRKLALRRTVRLHRTRAEELQRPHADRSEADGLLYARILDALGRDHEARAQLERLVADEHRSWQSIIALAQHLLDDQIGLLMVAARLGTTKAAARSARIAELLAAAQAMAPDQPEARAMLTILDVMQEYSTLYAAPSWDPLTYWVQRAEGIDRWYEELATRLESNPPALDAVAAVLSIRFYHRIVTALPADAPKVQDWHKLAMTLFGQPSAIDRRLIKISARALESAADEPARADQRLFVRLLAAIIGSDRPLFDRCIAKLRQRHPDSEPLLELIPCIPVADGDLATCRRLIDEILPTTQTWVPPFAIARRLIELEQETEALRLFEQALTRRPDSINCRLAYALVLLRVEEPNADRRVRELLQSITAERAVGAFYNRYRAFAHAGLAVLEVKNDRLEAAHRELQHATALDPTPTFLRLRAAVQWRLAAAAINENTRVRMQRLAVRSIVRATESSLSYRSEAKDGEQWARPDGATTTRWARTGLDWLASVPAGAVTKASRTRYSVRLLAAILGADGAEDPDQRVRRQLLEEIRRLSEADTWSDQHRRITAKIAAATENPTPELAEHGLAAVRYLVDASAGLDFEAAWLGAQILRDSNPGASLEMVLAALETAPAARGANHRPQHIEHLERTLIDLASRSLHRPEIRTRVRAFILARCERATARAPALWIGAALLMFDETPAARKRAAELLERVRGDEAEELAHRLLLSLLRFEQGRSSEGRKLLQDAADNLPPSDRILAARDRARLLMNGQLARESTTGWQRAVGDYFNPELVKVLRGRPQREKR